MFADPGPGAVTVAVLSPVRVVSAALALALADYPAVRVTAHGTRVDEVLEQHDESTAMVFVCDGSSPAAVQALRGIRERLPDHAVVVFGLCEHAEDLRTCAALGVTGCVARDSSLNELVRAALAAGRSERYLSPSLATGLGDQVPTRASLTRRERQVATYLVRNESYAAIGAALHVSPNTVKNHAHSIYRKCGTTDRTVLALRLDYSTD